MRVEFDKPELTDKEIRVIREALKSEPEWLAFLVPRATAAALLVCTMTSWGATGGRCLAKSDQAQAWRFCCHSCSA
jgi:hypothetical protein